MPDRKTSVPTSHAAPPTPAELRALLAHLLAGAAGGEEAQWARLVGEVEVLPIALNPRCNWRITPDGTIVERNAIEKATEVVREAHPYARSA